MKAIITLIFIIMIGALALSENKEIHENKNQNSKMGILLDSGTFRTINCEKIKIGNNNITELVRLYRFKNTRVKKALIFSLKRNKLKLA